MSGERKGEGEKGGGVGAALAGAGRCVQDNVIPMPVCANAGALVVRRSRVMPNTKRWRTLYVCG